MRANQISPLNVCSNKKQVCYRIKDRLYLLFGKNRFNKMDVFRSNTLKFLVFTSKAERAFA